MKLTIERLETLSADDLRDLQKSGRSRHRHAGNSGWIMAAPYSLPALMNAYWRPSR